MERLAGAVTAVAGFEKGSGKTTFLNFALGIARARGPVAAFTIGMDGGQKERQHGSSVEIHVKPGDIVMTTHTLARAARARFEVIESVSGRSALGRLFLGRARRAGAVTLVGPEHFSELGRAVSFVRREQLAESVLIDGSVNRITQVSALGGLQFVFTVRADRGNLARVAARVRAMAALSDLPLAIDDGIHRIEGPLTRGVLEAVPKGVERLSVEDFTKVFLEPQDTLKTIQRFGLHVRRRFDLLAFVVILRDLSRAEFLDAIGADVAPRVCFNPYEVAS